MEIFLVISVFVVVVSGQPQTLPYTISESTTSCYNPNLGQHLYMNANCSLSDLIAVNFLTAALKPDSIMSDGYCGNASILNYFDDCCAKVDTDCSMEYDPTLTTVSTAMIGYYDIHEGCNGQSSCLARANRLAIPNGVCDQQLFTETGTNYMYFNYYCIPGTAVANCMKGTLSGQGKLLYIQSPNFPHAVPSECGCSVETDDCSAGIELYTIQRILYPLPSSIAHGNSSCSGNQTLSISLDGINIHTTWTCEHNQVSITKDVYSDTTFMLVRFESIYNASEGSFWLGFKSTASGSNLEINCPPRNQTHCLSSTTTALLVTSQTTTSDSSTSSATSTTTPDNSTTTKSSTIVSSTTTITSKTTASDQTTSSTSYTTTSNMTAGNQNTTNKSDADTDTVAIALISTFLVLALVAVVVVSICLWQQCRTKTTKEPTNVHDAENASVAPAPANDTPTKLKKIKLKSKMVNTVEIETRQKSTSTTPTKMKSQSTATDTIQSKSKILQVTTDMKSVATSVTEQKLDDYRHMAVSAIGVQDSVQTPNKTRLANTSASTIAMQDDIPLSYIENDHGDESLTSDRQSSMESDIIPLPKKPKVSTRPSSARSKRPKKKKMTTAVVRGKRIASVPIARPVSAKTTASIKSCRVKRNPKIQPLRKTNSFTLSSKSHSPYCPATKQRQKSALRSLIINYRYIDRRAFASSPDVTPAPSPQALPVTAIDNMSETTQRPRKKRRPRQKWAEKTSLNLLKELVGEIPSQNKSSKIRKGNGSRPRGSVNRPKSH